MTILAVARGVAVKVGIDVPAALYSSTDREHVELVAVLQEAASRIIEAHDWQGLKKLATINGDGATIAHDVPADFFRFPTEMHLYSDRLTREITYLPNHDEWLSYDVKQFEVVQGLWTYLGGQILIKPAMVVGETAKYYYQSGHAVRDAGSALKAEFTADTDTFVLPERLLKLAGIWEWKSGKNLPYAEDLANYEHALADAIQRDRGPRVLAIGQSRFARGVDVAWPRTIQP